MIEWIELFVKAVYCIDNLILFFLEMLTKYSYFRIEKCIFFPPKKRGTNFGNTQ